MTAVPVLRSSGVGHRRRSAGRVAWALATAAVLMQVAWPLLDGEPLRLLTIASVIVFAAASVVHGAASRGAAYALGLVILAGGVGFAAEAVGVRTGLPFGDYAYADSLGPRVLGVPLVVPLAWVMMAHLCLLAGRRLAGPAASWLVAAWALASWDLFLDPQMVSAGHWTWSDPSPALAGVPGIPLSNYAGWLAVAVVLMLLLDRLPSRGVRDDGPATLLLLWTYGSQVLANAVFFDRPYVALWGGAAMGVVVVPYAAAAWRRR